LKKDRQHNGQKKKDKQRSTKHYTVLKKKLFANNVIDLTASSVAFETISVGYIRICRITLPVEFKYPV
jgi:hypothetical protein